MQVLLADIGDYHALNDWWRRQFPGIRLRARLDLPSRLGPFGAKIELQAVAEETHDR